MSLELVLSEAARTDFARYRPRQVIDAVNSLVPLGKAGALDAVESYLAAQDLEMHPQEGMFLVLRVLFEVPAHPGYHPPVLLGGSFPPPPPSPASLPHFPLVLIDDRPLLMISGYSLGGDAEPVRAHVEHFRATGTLRDRPLAPAASPGAVLDRFRSTYRDAYGEPPPERVVAMIQAQLDEPRP